MKASTPPLVPGLPFVGNAHDFMTDPIALIRRGQRLHGRVFGLRLGPRNVAVLLGPENHRVFFEQTDKLLSIREAYPFFSRMFDDNLFFMAEPDEYRAQRTIVLPAFQGPRMNSYVAAMAREANQFMDSLGDDGEFDLTRSLGPLVMNVAARAFLGEDFRQKLGGEFFDVFRDFSGGMEMVFPSWIPLPRLRRSDRAREHLHAMLQRLIDERRGPTATRCDDFLQTLVDARYPDGRPLADTTIIHLILMLVWAGHETTAGHISWGLIQLLQHPEYYARVLDEVRDVLGRDDDLSMEHARGLKRLEWALKETERTQPVAFVLARAAVKDVDVSGFRIPAGWMALTCAAVSHRLPEVFRDPDRYDPFRFAPDRAEDRQGYSLIGFGGGAHRCLGVNFAYLEMKVVLALLLRRYELELVDRDPTPIRGPGTKWPTSPARVRYRRRRAEVPPRATRASIDRPEVASPAGCPVHTAPITTPER